MCLVERGLDYIFVQCMCFPLTFRTAANMIALHQKEQYAVREAVQTYEHKKDKRIWQAQKAVHCYNESLKIFGW